MTNEIKIMIVVLVVCVAILFGGAWLYQKNAPGEASNILTTNQEVLVREDSLKIVAPHQKVVVVEFADYQCPACAYVAPKVKELRDTYKDNVTFVYRNFPLKTIHPNSVISAQMARIAGEQGKYWEMHEKLYTSQTEWESLSDPTNIFISYAEQMGLATSSIKEKLSSGAYVDKINSDLKDGESVGVNSTPTFFVGNKIIRSADYNALKKAIDDAISASK
jgi:protein-disulfide isomerase